MKKIIPIILVVLVAGVAGYFLMNKGSSVKISTPKKAKNYNFNALKAAVDLGTPLKCSYSYGEVEYQGYVKGKQWRGKMKRGDGQVVDVIVKGDCLWSWGEDQPQGVKMCFDVSEEGSIWDQTETSEGIEYTCKPTTVDDSLFEPPSDVNFINIDEMMN